VVPAFGIGYGYLERRWLGNTVQTACEVGRSGEGEGLAAAAHGAEVEILVGERNWELCEGISPFYTSTCRRLLA